MKFRVFIDGSEGTTGLRIRERLRRHGEVALLEIKAEKRKDTTERLRLMREADVSILCLPDEASREIVELLPAGVRVLDSSTAFRTDKDWLYGLPELEKDDGLRRRELAYASRVSVPGCHATGFILIARPLVESGLVSPDFAFACTSITGYSGGGKSMIDQYVGRPGEFDAPRAYGLTQQHKHLPEMKKYAKLSAPPLFVPIVANYFSGMLVSISLRGARFVPGDIRAMYSKRYRDEELIRVIPATGSAANGDEGTGFLSAGALSGRDDVEIHVHGRPGNVTVSARFDNLGKGASGAAVQNLNLMLNMGEFTGLAI